MTDVLGETLGGRIDRWIIIIITYNSNKYNVYLQLISALDYSTDGAGVTTTNDKIFFIIVITIIYDFLLNYYYNNNKRKQALIVSI